MTPLRFRIGDREVGDRCPSYVIAEAGVNHNGDVDLAHRLVDVAARAGADAVKFQLFDPGELVSADATTAPYQRRTTGKATQRELLDELVLPDDAWSGLASHAADLGLAFFATAVDRRHADLLVQLDVPAFKVPSGELNNLRLIRDLAARGRPLIISTGMGTLEEVGAALSAAAAAPAKALLHCVSAYPAPASAANLRAVATLANHFRVVVGWSDHTVGSLSAIAAVALGAAMFEKHVTVDRQLPGPDHAASADPDEFASYVRAVREAEAALGDGVKRPVAEEEENRHHVRRSLHAVRDLAVGEVIEDADVVLRRPDDGLPPDAPVVGRTVARALAHGQPIRAEDLL